MSKRLPAELASADIRLLLACARARLTPAHQDLIRSLLAGPLDWRQLLIQAQRHGIAALLATHLEAVAPGEIPEVHREFLRMHLSDSSRRGLTLTGAMLRILDALQGGGVAAVPYKGPVLALALYGNLALREYSDIDLLVRQREIPRAVAILTQLGYRPDFDPAVVCALPRPAPGQYAFGEPSSGVIVELHTELTLRYFPARPDFDSDWSRMESVAIGGRQVPSLSPEHLLLYLCVHGGKDFWERLAWVCDVAELIRARPGLDWNTVLARTRAARAEGILLLGLALAQDLLEVELPQEVSRRLATSQKTQRLADRVRRSFFLIDSVTPGLVDRIRFRSDMYGGGWGAFSYSLRLAFSPTDEDAGLVAVPTPLAPLYGLLRPLRLLRKHGLGRRQRPRE